jgi:hypothetical protein
MYAPFAAMMLIMYDKAMQKRVAPWTEEPVYAESDLES